MTTATAYGNGCRLEASAPGNGNDHGNGSAAGRAVREANCLAARSVQAPARRAGKARMGGTGEGRHR